MNHKVLGHIKFSPIIIGARISFPSYFRVVFVAQLIPSCYIVGRQPMHLSISISPSRAKAWEQRQDIQWKQIQGDGKTITVVHLPCCFSPSYYHRIQSVCGNTMTKSFRRRDELKAV